MDAPWFLGEACADFSLRTGGARTDKTKGRENQASEITGQSAGGAQGKSQLLTDTRVERGFARKRLEGFRLSYLI